jgi:hypothetical protein
MKKQDVINFFGSVDAVSKAVRSSGSAVSQWPEELTDRLKDRILGACTRLHRKPPKHWIPKPAVD